MCSNVSLLIYAKDAIREIHLAQLASREFRIDLKRQTYCQQESPLGDGQKPLLKLVSLAFWQFVQNLQVRHPSVVSNPKHFIRALAIP
jgi:hypothetical protein